MGVGAPGSFQIFTEEVQHFEADIVPGACVFGSDIAEAGDKVFHGGMLVFDFWLRTFDCLRNDGGSCNVCFECFRGTKVARQIKSAGWRFRFYLKCNPRQPIAFKMHLAHMKKILPAFFVLSILTMCGWSCNKEDGLAPGFDMVFQRDFSIPAGIGVFDVHHFQLKNIPTNWQQYLDQHGKTADQIQSVITSEMSLGGIFGDADLSVIDRISVRLYDESNPSDYLEIAYRDPAPFDSGNVLPLIPSLADSKRFFTTPRFSVDVVVWLRRTTQDQSEVRLNMTMRSTF